MHFPVSVALFLWLVLPVRLCDCVHFNFLFPFFQRFSSLFSFPDDLIDRSPGDAFSQCILLFSSAPRALLLPVRRVQSPSAFRLFLISLLLLFTFNLMWQGMCLAESDR